MDMNINVTNDAPIVQHRDYENEIFTILRGNLSPKLKKEQVLAYHENDIAAAMELLDTKERVKLYSILGAEAFANVLEYSENINEYISELTLKRKLLVIAELEASTASDYLAELEEDERKNLVELLDEETKQDILDMWHYDRDFACCKAC